MASRFAPQRPLRNLALVLAAAVALSCGDTRAPELPDPAVDLLAQADAASEIIEPALVWRHGGRLLGNDAERYIGEELRRIGLVGAGPGGSWQQPFERRRRLGRVGAPWVLRQGGRQVVLAGGRDLAAALGGKWGRVRLRGVPVVFVAPTLAAPAASLAGKVLVVLAPAEPAANAASPLPDLFRRAVATGAYGVVVLPRPGTASALPTATAAAVLTEGSGLPFAAWSTEAAARQLTAGLAGTSLEGLARLEWRPSLLPFPLGSLHGELVSEVDRTPYHNLVGIVHARQGGLDETVALVAPLPGGGGPAERRARAAAAAELLAAATAFQALSDAPRRTVLVSFTDPGEDGLAGARRLAADDRWGGLRLAGAVVLAAGKLAGPTLDVTVVGARGSPLGGLAARVAARQGQRIGPELEPGRSLFWTSPARAFVRAGIPTAMLGPGSRPLAASPGANLPASTVGTAGGPVALGMVQEARLAFRLALELAEGTRLPRVDAQRVEQALRVPLPAPTPAVPLRRSGRPGVAISSTTPAGDAGAGAAPTDSAAASGQDAAAAERELARAPGFMAPPAAEPPPEPAAAPAPLAAEPAPTAEPAPAATPSPTPPRRRAAAAAA